MWVSFLFVQFYEPFYFDRYIHNLEHILIRTQNGFDDINFFLVKIVKN